MSNMTNQPYTLKCSLINCQSVVNKTQLIQTEVFTNKLDICALMKTWIKQDDKLTTHHICPPGYKYITLPWPNKMGGGIAIIHKEEINATLQDNSCTPSLEHTVFSIENEGLQESNSLHLVYRPPDSSVTSFADKCERDITKPGQITLLGDFNIKMNKPKDADFLESFGLENWVKCTTNHTENTIDLITTQENSIHVSNIVKNTLFSDHHLLLFNITSAKSVPTYKTITYRKIKKIDKDAFWCDIEAAIKASKYLNMIYRKISTSTQN